MTVLHHLPCITVRLAVSWMTPLHNFKRYHSTLSADMYADKELPHQLLGNSNL